MDKIDIHQNKKNSENKKNDNTIVKKELNYDRIKEIVKKSKKSSHRLEEGNVKLIKLIFSQFHYTLKRTAQIMFDF